MKLRWVLNSLVILLVLGGLFLDFQSVPAATVNADEKIENSLLEQISTRGQADFIVRFGEQADLSAAYEMGWIERGEYVVRELQRTATKQQARVKGILDAAGMRHETFIAGNELYVWQGTLAAAIQIAELPEVESVREPQTFSISPLTQASPPMSYVTWAGDLLAYDQLASAGDMAAAVTWGLNAVHAVDFWAEFGFQGDGIIVANIDTGVQWNHPGLDQAYRCGTNPYDPKCWYDPTYVCTAGACDNHGHGTHTMGTMVSDDDPTLPYIAGMAPNAKWIACKGCEYDNCAELTLNLCADWILAPGGSSANRPHIVNNSWGGPGGNSWFDGKVTAWRAAGIFPSFPSGNTGPTCATIESPGDYQTTLASAAHNQLWSIASFSSPGPSYFGHDPYTKPNITAPGVDIMSTIPTSTWGRSSGTSMAAPHSSGAVALLWSCNSSLIGQIDATFQALQSTAWIQHPGSCGAPPDGEGNYTYGYGNLNVLFAGTENCTDVAIGYLEGDVTDLVSGQPIEGALIDVALSLVADETVDIATDPSGHYSMSLPVGTYTINVSAPGYAPQSASVNVLLGQTIQKDFQLEWMGLWTSGPADPTEFWRYDCTWFDDGSGLSAYNLKIYCMGGRTGTVTESGAIWRFDAATQKFTDTTHELNPGVSNYTANVIKDAGGWAIYVIGGYDYETATAVNNVQRYDPVTGIVTQVATDPLPMKLGGYLVTPGACVGANDKIYCLGGLTTIIAPYFSVETWEFDPSRAPGLRWDRIESANLSVGRGYIQAAVQNGVIYAMGGLYEYDPIGPDYSPTAVVEALDLNNLAAGWKLIPAMPVPTAEGRGFSFSGDSMLNSIQEWGSKLYVVGGGDWPAQTSQVLEYDLATQTWNTDFPELIQARRDHAGVFVPLCTADPTDGLPGMWVFGGRIVEDTPPYGEPEFYPMPCSEPTPVIALTKTVGVDPSVCASTEKINIQGPTDVTYCYTLYNNSPITMTVHDLIDSSLGVLLDGYSHSLDPGESYVYTQTVSIDSTTFNLAAWTAYDDLGNSYQAYDYASVAYQDDYYIMYLPFNVREY